MDSKEYVVEAVRAYLKDRCAVTLNDVVLVMDGHWSSNPAYKAKKGLTMIAIRKNDLLENEAAIVALFGVHEGMVKTRARIARTVRNDLQLAHVNAQYEYVDIPYKDLPIGKNGTRSAAIEKLACAWLNYRWSGNMLHSALYDHETNARLGKKGGRAVADGYNAEGALEVKCKRGRTTYLSDVVK